MSSGRDWSNCCADERRVGWAVKPRSPWVADAAEPRMVEWARRL
jgi:hypothetical protein